MFRPAFLGGESESLAAENLILLPKKNFLKSQNLHHMTLVLHFTWCEQKERQKI